MSSTAGKEAGQGPAPWRAAFQEHMSRMESPEFVLSTVETGSDGGLPYVPRARYCIYRGFWGELPDNKRNAAARNARVYESELPTFTTDARMLKVAQLFKSGGGQARDEEQWQGSGGGGPVEAVWWVKDAMTQWRFRGQAFVVGPDIEGDGEESSGVRTVKSEVGSRMRAVQQHPPPDEDSWSWAKEVTAHFGNLSPGMRGSFSGPPPGRPTDQPYDGERLKLGRPVDDVDDAVARKHFRVVVIKPDEVEKMDLSDAQKARRHLYTFVKETSEWKTQELWP